MYPLSAFLIRACNGALITICIIIVSTSTGLAFDGNRAGFILGGGAGYAPHAGVTSSTTGIDGNAPGLALSLHIGWAFGESNVITYGGTTTIGDFSFEDTEWEVLEAYEGIHWYHFFGQTGRSLFSCVGAGLFHFGLDVDSRSVGEGIGPAYTLGVGYEYLKQLQIGIYLVGGRTTLAGTDFGHFNLNFQATFTAY